jgi:hypothetical protein
MKLFGKSDGMRHAGQQPFLLAAAVVMLASTLGFSAQREQTAAQPSPPSNENTDATATAAAARKKRFEEERRRLEEAVTSGSQTPAGESGQTLFISPAIVNMVLGDTQSFSAFDISGTTVTHSAQWSVSNSSVAELSAYGDPTITSKSHGTVTVRARIGMRDAQATVTVISGASLAIGSIRWSSGDIPGFKTRKILPAVPSAGGPDVYEVADGANGETLVRALASDGRQLWMRRFGKGVRPGSLPGMPASAVAH